MNSVKEQSLGKISMNTVESIISGLDKIKFKLQELIEQESLDGYIIDDIRSIQCIVDEARKIGENKKDNLKEKIDQVLAKVDEAINKINIFHTKYTESLPITIFDNLRNILKSCEEQLNDFRERLGFVKKSVTPITELFNSNTRLEKNSNKHTFQAWATAMEAFAEAIEDFLEICPEFSTTEIENFVKDVLVITASKARKDNRKENYRKRLRYAATFVSSIIESKKSYLFHEEISKISENQDTLKRNSLLDEIWLNPEEDEAWKDL